MKLPTYCLFVLFLCFSSAASAQTTGTPSVPSKNTTIPTFSGLNVQGPVNVIIEAKAKAATPNLQISGNAKTIAQVNWQVKNNSLSLGMKGRYWPRRGDKLSIKLNVTPTQLKHINFNSNGILLGKGLSGSLSLTAAGKGSITLCTSKLNLNALTAHDQVNITLHNLASSNLTIADKTAGKIMLDGEVHVQTINFISNGSLAIYWLTSPYLHINATGKGKLLLAGVTKTLDAQLSQTVHLFAKSLRVENGFIATRNQARAEVTIKNKLSASAKDDSVIYYSTPVNFLNTTTQNSGLILAN
jgi:hypothetical protein